MFPFEKLGVYEGALEYAAEVYRVTAAFPSEERYALTSQGRRAATSIPLNIAEGRGRGTDKDFVRFLFMARGSIFETVTVLELATRFGYLQPTERDSAKAQAFELSSRIMALIKSLTPRPLDS
jgi:four helix bundle protein